MVWFLREGDDLLVYCKPDASKLANIAVNPNVAFNLRGDELGDTMATFEGTAQWSSRRPRHIRIRPISTSTGNRSAGSDGVPDQFAADYSALIRITIDRIRSW